MIAAVKQWLHRLGINAYIVDTTENRHSLLVDRLRNGVTLCDLVMLLEPKEAHILNFHDCVRYEPRNAHEVLTNVCAALNVFKKMRSPPIHPRLLIDPDAIISGDSDFCDNLLYEIMNSYHRSEGFGLSPEMWFKLSKRNKGWLQYTPLERQRLEQCLIQWLIDNGTLQELGLHDRIMKKKQLLR